MVTSPSTPIPAPAMPDVPASDLGPLSWVLDETRKSVQSATKALKRYARDAESARGVDLASVDASQLRVARHQLHQAGGALEMVGQGVAAQMVRGMEAVAQQFVAHPEACSEAAASTLERCGFALVEFVEDQLSARPRPALGLFPQYRQVQEMAGVDRIHPADLWPVPWRWVDPHTPAAAQPLTCEPAVRQRLEHSILKVMKRGDVHAAGELATISLSLAEGFGAPTRPAIFWKLAAGFFDALAHELLRLDVYVKRAASRVLLQYMSLARGDPEISERLALDLLFFCSQACPRADAPAPTLAAVRDAWQLGEREPVDYDVPTFGLYDPAVLAQARRRIEAMKENWSALAGGDSARLKACVDQFTLVIDSLERLHEQDRPLAAALGEVVRLLQQTGKPPAPELAIETATTILFLEASFEDFRPQDPTAGTRMRQLAERLDTVRQGGHAPALEPWMEELYRSVSDRQTMGTVVGELRVTLGEIEQHLDQYFRKPADPVPLEAVPGLMGQMRGVLSVLGLDQAALAIGHMRERVEALRERVPDAAEGELAQEFERLGSSLGAFGFLVDTLGYQPALARELFHYDEQTGEFRYVAGRVRRATVPHGEEPVAGSGPQPVVVQPERAAQATESGPSLASEPSAAQLEQIAARAALDERPALAQAASRAAQAARGEDGEFLDSALKDLENAASAGAVPPMVAEPAAQAEPSEDDDDDLLGIFLEEAREVLATGSSAVSALADAPDDLETLTTLRRSFHTLKGSSRMVGLTEFGAAAWSLEQLLNACLAEQKPASADLRAVSADALAAFGRWVDAIDAQHADAWRAEPFERLADGLRLHGERLMVALDPQAAEPDLPQAERETTPVEPVHPAPEAQELLEQADQEAVTAPEPPVSVQQVEFELPDLTLGEPQEAAGESAEMSGVSAQELSPEEFADSAAAEPAARGSGDALSAFDLPDLELPQVPSAEQHPVVEAAPSVAGSIPDLSDLLEIDLDAGALADATAPAVEEPAESAAPPREVVDFQFDLAPQRAVDGEIPGLEVSEPIPLEEVDEQFGVEMGRHDAEPAVSQQDEQPQPVAAEADDGGVREIGGLRISTPLYNVYLSEADGWSSQLASELSDWAGRLEAPVPERAIACAHSLAGSSATVGFTALSELARAVEHALDRLQGQVAGTAEQSRVLGQAADEIRRLLHQFAAGILKEPVSGLLDAVRAIEPVTQVESGAAPDEQGEPQRPAEPAGASTAPAPLEALSTFGTLEAVEPARELEEGIDVADAVDPDLFPIFEEEADELLPRLGAALRQWVEHPHELGARSEVLRVLHTLKGSARLAGALRLGEMAHRTESAVEGLGTEDLTVADVAPLQDYLDRLLGHFQQLRSAASAAAPTLGEAVPPEPAEPVESEPAEAPAESAPVVVAGEVAAPTAFSFATARVHARQTVRVRAQLLDRLMAQAGEVMTARARLETDLRQLRTLQNELAGNVERLRRQLRDVELQAETQMQSRLAQSRDAQQAFDPLEFDRFTRMQELSRMMAESVNDVAMVQRNLQRLIDASEDDLAAQARQSRSLQDDLLRTRMTEFEGISERLYRVVRQAAKEAGKQVRLDIAGGGIEIDRGILDRMTPAFEHLLRNSVVHGIEVPAERERKGKDPTGVITIEVQQAGNDVAIEFRDDGAGLDLTRIRARAVERGLIGAEQVLSDAELSQLIFAPGFSTADEVTEIAGRGVGTDVVRAEIQALGGRIETRSEAGTGTAFRLVLPLTTAVTQVVMIRVDDLVVGVPSSLVEVVLRGAEHDIDQAYAQGTIHYGGESVPFYWAGALLQHSARSTAPMARRAPVLITRSATQRVALHVDEVLGNQEVVVKALGPQLSRLPGLVSITALASGAVRLIYNPVALAAVYGERARALGAQPEAVAQPQAQTPVAAETPAAAPIVPLVLVVDDSITVRRVTQRLLQREGYRVALAADGLQGLERLHQERPAVVLSDIEMPRMDGFDFLRNIRADESLRDLPVVMITSRIAEKHRDHARALGASHYLGKPYSEEELLGLIRTYARVETASPVI